MKRYSVGTLGTLESEDGEWVPAGIAAEMYVALKRIVEEYGDQFAYRQGTRSPYDQMTEAIAKADSDGVQHGNGGS